MAYSGQIAEYNIKNEGKGSQVIVRNSQIWVRAANFSGTVAKLENVSTLLAGILRDMRDFVGYNSQSEGHQPTS